MSDGRPIGVFDRGIGGVTVLGALRERLPKESFVYLGDTARVPYGTKGAPTVSHFAAEATLHLLERGVKSVVVACNTASAVGLDHLRTISAVPVFGVIEPGVEAALKETRGRVGIIGTLATVNSQRYQELLRRARPDLDVHAMACPLFVPLAEEGWVEDPITLEVAERYLGGLRERGVDTLILGCTHYPLLKGAIGQVMGTHVQLVDSALVLAEAVAEELEARSALRADESAGELQILVSDVPQRFAELSRRFLALEVPSVEVVDLEVMNVPASRLESER
jgi:glutamate racemase